MPQYLSGGSRDELIQELKAWVERRKLNNQAYAKLCVEFTENKKLLMAIPQLPGSNQQESSQMSEIKNRCVEGVNSLRVRRPPVMRKLSADIHCQTLTDERAAGTLHGQFLVATISQRGIAQRGMSSPIPEYVDVEICALLNALDKTYDGRKELKTLAEILASAKRPAERAVKDTNHAENIAQGPLPGAEPQAIGVIASQARQEITKNPPLSMARAMDTASDMHLGEGVMDMAMGHATLDTIAQMLDHIQDLAKGLAPFHDTNASAAATKSTPDMAQHQSANPSKSKAKKKNDARKARRKALAKEAVAGDANESAEDADDEDDVEAGGMD